MSKIFLGQYRMLQSCYHGGKGLLFDGRHQATVNLSLVRFWRYSSIPNNDGAVAGSRFLLTRRKFYERSEKRRLDRAKRRSERAERVVDHMDNFFVKYSDFQYTRSTPIWKEFEQMCNHFGWDEDSDEMRKAKNGFKNAMVLQFNDIYGTDEEDLGSWQKLCRVLNMEPVPTRLAECRKCVSRIHVNLVDLVDTKRTGTPVTIFQNLEQLQEYTIDNEKFFPKENAYAGGLLRYLLRHIF